MQECFMGNANDHSPIVLAAVVLRLGFDLNQHATNRHKSNRSCSRLDCLHYHHYYYYYNYYYYYYWD